MHACIVHSLLICNMHMLLICNMQIYIYMYMHMHVFFADFVRSYYLHKYLHVCADLTITLLLARLFTLSISTFLQVLMLRGRLLYRVFGSGSMHGPYAMFQSKSRLLNHGREIGLLRAAGTRMATVFYALHRALRLRQALLATIHSPEWQGSKFKSIVNRAAKTVECSGMWKCIYFLLRAVFPALRLLRYADSNTPAMDKVEFLLHRTEQAFIKSADDLNNDAIWEELSLDIQIEEEADTVDAAEFDDDADDASDEDNDDASLLLLPVATRTRSTMMRTRPVTKRTAVSAPFFCASGITGRRK